MKTDLRGIRFEPDPEFAEMFNGLQNMLNKKGFVYFLDIDEISIKKFRSSFLYENKLYGWLLPTDKALEFEEEYLRGDPSQKWDSYRKNYWVWFDGEGCMRWLYSERNAWDRCVDLKPSQGKSDIRRETE